MSTPSPIPVPSSTTIKTLNVPPYAAVSERDQLANLLSNPILYQISITSPQIMQMATYNQILALQKIQSLPTSQQQDILTQIQSGMCLPSLYTGCEYPVTNYKYAIIALIIVIIILILICLVLALK